MKDALIVEILKPLWIVYKDLNDDERVPHARKGARRAPRLKQAIDSVKKDLEIFIGDNLDPD